MRVADTFPTALESALPQPERPATPGRRRQLWAELLALFVGVPLVMLAAFGLYPLFPALIALALLAAWLLICTPGFRWGELLEGRLLSEWRFLLGFTLITAAACYLLVLWLTPQSLFAIPRHRPELWLMLVLLYPIFSALPQELIFRPLFFRRYAGLFPGPGTAVMANGLLFGFAHLFYQNAVAIGLTTVAGMVIGWAYQRSGSFLMACLLHAIGGLCLFTFGLGRFFYHGAVPG